MSSKENKAAAAGLMKLRNRSAVRQYINKSQYFPRNEKNTLLKEHNTLLRKGDRGFNLKFVKNLENMYKQITRG
jgi:hypothetical protein